MAASILACFKLELKKDEDGKDIKIDYAKTLTPTFVV